MEKREPSHTVGGDVNWCSHYRKQYAAAKSLQLCPTPCDPIDGSPPGSPVPGILQARTLEWIAISFSNAWKWKVKVKSLSCVQLFETSWTAAYQAAPSMGLSRQGYWSGLPLPSPTENSIEIPQKIKFRTILWSSIPLLSIYQMKMKTQIRKDIFTHMFIASLFVIVRIWKEPKCL